MGSTGLQGRWQTIGKDPLMICDTGHNVEGMAWVVQQLKATSFQQLHMVIGFVKDKDVTSILKLLPVKARYYFTNANIPRALDAQELKTKALTFGLLGEHYVSVQEAFEAAKTNASKEDLIFIGGSTFVVAEAI
jgi:dihydrofolate synthase/folylpolyglutamate synthase